MPFGAVKNLDSNAERHNPALFSGLRKDVPERSRGFRSDRLTVVLNMIEAEIMTGLDDQAGFQSGYEKAKIRAEFYSKLSLRYERLWNRVVQQLEEAAIYAELDLLLEQESLAPADPDEEFDDRLRERAYRILIQKKGLSSIASA